MSEKSIESRLVSEVALKNIWDKRIESRIWEWVIKNKIKILKIRINNKWVSKHVQ